MSIETSLATRLIEAQFPQWADLPIEPVVSASTDNALFRLGADMRLRLLRVAWVPEQVEKEQLWLPNVSQDLYYAIWLQN